MFGRTTARTGIDIGTTSVKLVRMEGHGAARRITHLGSEPWDGSIREERHRHAGAALGALLARHGLKRKRLGRVAVTSAWHEHALREVSLPAMTEQELQKALPFEAPNHLDLEGMEQPVLAGQVLGPDPDDPDKVRVLLAAVPRPRRDFALAVLAENGLVPETVDLEPLAGLNALLAALGDELADETPVALLDLGGHHTSLHIGSRRGGLLSRNVAPGAPADPAGDAEGGYLMKLTSGVQQTLTYYRTRHKREVSALYLTGGGALAPHRAENLREATRLPVQVFDPLAATTVTATGDGDLPPGPLYTTACGLCHWWDGV